MHNLKKEGIALKGEVSEDYQGILSPEALRFIAKLERQHGKKRRELLNTRKERQKRFNRGELPDFIHSSAANPDWKVATAPKDLEKRWVEITGPASSRKMVINALNSGAHTYMADAEDSESPVWDNLLKGQQNLSDAIRKRIMFTEERTNKQYQLADNIATLIFRPRGWHLSEQNVSIDGNPISASLFDFGLYIFNNAEELIARDSGPYFYLPKMESHLEAMLWNQVLDAAREELKIPSEKVKVTALIETLPAAFEMEGILFALKDYIVGLNCGRWDYIFSYIKTLSEHKGFMLPDRAQITMDKGFLEAYAKLLIQTCHKRGAYAMGGMAAQIPVKNNALADEALEAFRQGNYEDVLGHYKSTWVGKVLADKVREASIGHDGTWIAHPGLREIAMAAFKDKLGEQPHQMNVLPEGKITPEMLLHPIKGNITYDGLYANVRIGIEYMASWLRGNGCVPLNNLMEDAATAEISRAQVWQWLRHKAKLEDGRAINKQILNTIMERVKQDISQDKDFAENYRQAAQVFKKLSESRDFQPFLTIPAYELLMQTR